MVDVFNIMTDIKDDDITEFKSFMIPIWTHYHPNEFINNFIEIDPLPTKELIYSKSEDKE
jgi:hypothetical protein